MQDIHNKPTLETETEINEMDNALELLKEILRKYPKLEVDESNYDLGNHSGYYSISAKLTCEELNGYVTFHRGDGLPNLQEDENIHNLLLSESARKEIKKTEVATESQSIVKDIFTQDEVADILKSACEKAMYIYIKPVPENSISNYVSRSLLPYGTRPKAFEQTLLHPSNDDKYYVSVQWSPINPLQDDSNE